MINQSETDKLKKLMNECDHLNAEDKAKLLKHLLGDSSVQVIIGSSQFHATNVYQVNLTSPEQISTILEAIAKKISSNDS